MLDRPIGSGGSDQRRLEGVKCHVRLIVLRAAPSFSRKIDHDLLRTSFFLSFFFVSFRPAFDPVATPSAKQASSLSMMASTVHTCTRCVPHSAVKLPVEATKRRRFFVREPLPIVNATHFGGLVIILVCYDI